MKKYLLSAAVVLLFAAPAFPADMPLKAPPPVYSWTGCYLDAGIGYGMWNQDHYGETGPGTLSGSTSTFTRFSVSYTNGGRGWAGQAGAGCDYQVAQRWVVGVFGDYDPMSFKGTNEFPASPPPAGPTGIADISGSEKETGAWGVGGRLGYLLTPALLTYVNGGYTQARFSGVSFFTEYFPSTFTGFSMPAHTYKGWFIGSGMDYNLGWLPGLMLRTEYRYASYGAADVPLLTATGALSGDYEHSKKATQTVVTGIVWRFNSWGGPVRAAY